MTANEYENIGNTCCAILALPLKALLAYMTKGQGHRMHSQPKAQRSDPDLT